MAGPKPPRVVAELGRPETPEETAARRAETARAHRSNQTVLNLVAAVVASLGIVLFLVLVVVRPDQAEPATVDYAAIASEAQVDAAAPLIVPRLPESWAANAAHLSEVGEVQTWYVGFMTAGDQFIALNQGIDANPTWQAALLRAGEQTGTISIDGITWEVYDRRDAEQPGNLAYALATTAGTTTVVLHGTADDAEFEALATAIAGDIAALAEGSATGGQ